MAVGLRSPLPRFVQLGRAETLTCPARTSTGDVASCSAATFALLDADGANVVAATAATVTNGVASYALPSSFADEYELPLDAWREQWVLTGITGEPTNVTLEQEVRVCRVAPVAHVDVEALYRMHPQWRRQLPQSRTSFDEPIADAWNELIGRLLGDGHLPNRVLNWWALAIVHRYWAAHIVCRDFQTDAPNDSRWSRLADEYWKRSQSEYEHHLGLQLDTNEDGAADTPGELAAAEPPLFLTDVPIVDRGWSPWR